MTGRHQKRALCPIPRNPHTGGSCLWARHTYWCDETDVRALEREALRLSANFYKRLRYTNPDGAHFYDITIWKP